jgi:hypothetical protein
MHSKACLNDVKIGADAWILKIWAIKLQMVKAEN